MREDEELLHENTPDEESLLRLRRASYERLSRAVSIVRERYILQPETATQPTDGESQTEYYERKHREKTLLDAQMRKCDEVRCLSDALDEQRATKEHTRQMQLQQPPPRLISPAFSDLIRIVWRRFLNAWKTKEKQS